ncbi:MAG: putative toxin-antitoxin system toxin component, PIN family [Candidatus Humimicrobiaceae bacterium]
MIKVVLDTNVIIAAFVARGLSNSVFELCLDKFEVIISEYIIKEISKKLIDKIKIPEEKVNEIIDFLRDCCTIFNYESLKESICRDKKDDEILALAKGSSSKYIVAGDKDLLVLINFDNIKIINPRQLWEISKDMGFYD